VTGAFSLQVPLARLGPRPLTYVLEADTAQCAALAARFDLESISRLQAQVDVVRAGAGASLTGTLLADVVQHCVVSGEPVPAHVSETLELKFEPAPDTAEDLELEADALDVLPVESDAIDLGEAVAQSLFLALDPYPRADPAAIAEARRLLKTEAEIEAAVAAEKAAASPFAKLKRE
jgi:uncharacterized metal-binding protein YceD (DUF177 family)